MQNGSSDYYYDYYGESGSMSGSAEYDYDDEYVYEDMTTMSNSEQRENRCVCRLLGDPIVYTFDGQFIMLAGTHKYTFVKCATDPIDSCNFNIEVKTQKLVHKEWFHGYPTFISYVEIQIFGAIVHFAQDHKINLDGQPIDMDELPFVTAKYKIYNHENPKNPDEKFVIFYVAQCDIVVGFYGRGLDSVVIVSIPGRFGGHMLGLCGDCDGLPNDLHTRMGEDVSLDDNMHERISESYQVEDDGNFRWILKMPKGLRGPNGKGYHKGKGSKHWKWTKKGNRAYKGDGKGSHKGEGIRNRKGTEKRDDQYTSKGNRNGKGHRKGMGKWGRNVGNVWNSEAMGWKPDTTNSGRKSGSHSGSEERGSGELDGDSGNHSRSKEKGHTDFGSKSGSRSGSKGRGGKGMGGKSGTHTRNKGKGSKGRSSEKLDSKSGSRSGSEESESGEEATELDSGELVFAG